VFLLLQTAAIAFLVLHYGGRPGAAVAYTGVLAAAVALLLSPAAPPHLLWAMQASVLVTVVVARVSSCYKHPPSSLPPNLRVKYPLDFGIKGL
jgi:hypothetical protein